MRTPLHIALGLAASACAAQPQPEVDGPAPEPSPAAMPEPPVDPRVKVRLGGSSRAHDGAVRALASTRDGRFLITGGADGNVRLWDATTGSMAVSTQVGRVGVASLAIDDEQSKVLSGGEDGVISVLDRKSWSVVRSVKVAELPVTKVAQVGRDVFFGLRNGSGGVLDLDEERVFLVPDSRDIEAPSAFASLRDPKALRYDRDDAIGDSSGGIRVERRSTCIPGSTGSVTRRMEGAHAGPVTVLLRVFWTDVLVSGGADGALRFWDLKNLKRIAEFTGGASPITDLLKRDDSDILWVAREDGTVLGYGYAELLATPATR